MSKEALPEETPGVVGYRIEITEPTVARMEATLLGMVDRLCATVETCMQAGMTQEGHRRAATHAHEAQQLAATHAHEVKMAKR